MSQVEIVSGEIVCVRLSLAQRLGPFVSLPIFVQSVKSISRMNECSWNKRSSIRFLFSARTQQVYKTLVFTTHFLGKKLWQNGLRFG